MRTRAQAVWAAALIVLLVANISSALIQPITSVKAGRNGSPPYNLTSVSVKGYTVEAESLAVGRSTGSCIFSSSIDQADDFDLHSVAARNASGIWTVTSINDQPTWTNTNGDAPDFFIFEAGMNDDLSVQAILPGGKLGKTVDIPASMWGDTGLVRTGLLNGGQHIGGLAFSITDLLDGSGNALGLDAVIEGIQINSGDVDPTHFSAAVPEPATFAILGLGWLLAIRRHRSK